MRMVVALLIAAFSGIAHTAAVGLDPAKSEVRFTVTKLGFSDVTGVFHVFNADVRYDAARPENSSVRWRVDIASVETGERNRDSALQSSDYFAARQYPHLTFESRTVRRVADNVLEVTGDISIRGVTKRITVPVRITEPNGRRTFVTDFTLDRYDYGVRGGTVMGRLIGPTVQVHLVAAEGGTK